MVARSEVGENEEVEVEEVDYQGERYVSEVSCQVVPLAYLRDALVVE
jgi:hypothetical protein